MQGLEDTMDQDLLPHEESTRHTGSQFASNNCVDGDFEGPLRKDYYPATLKIDGKTALCEDGLLYLDPLPTDSLIAGLPEGFNKLSHHSVTDDSGYDTLQHSTQSLSGRRIHTRKVRKVGACPMCRKRKVKCSHALSQCLPEDDNLATAAPEASTLAIERLKLVSEEVNAPARAESEIKDSSSDATTILPALFGVRPALAFSDIKHAFPEGNFITRNIPRCNPEYTSRSQSPDQLSENQMDYLMAEAKHKILAFGMKRVYDLIASSTGYNIQACTVSSGNRSSRPPSSTDSQQPSQNSSEAKGKRKMGDRDSPPPDKGGGKKSQPVAPGSGDSDSTLLLACPFYKHDPDKYCTNVDTGKLYRVCMGPGFKVTSHIVQHLERKHRNPHQCPRCWCVKENREDLTAHASKGCDVRDPQPEYIDQRKWDRIKKRGVSWEEIYETLFPGWPVPSPYFEKTAAFAEPLLGTSAEAELLTASQSFIRRETMRLAESRISLIIDSDIDQRLGASILEIFNSCLLTAISNYEQTQERRAQGTELVDSTPVLSVPPYTRGPNQNPTPIVPPDEQPQLAPHVAAHVHRRLSDTRTRDLIQSQDMTPDSGYRSGSDICLCLCHWVVKYDENPCSNSNCRDGRCNWQSTFGIVDFEKLQDLEGQ